MLTLALTTLLALAQEPPPPPCQAAEHRQFDFWIGDWTVTMRDGKTAGTNHIEAILNGCVLQESWTGASGSTGRSFNMYYAPTGQWRQTWVDGNGGRLDLAGGLVEGAMVLAGETPSKEGGTVKHEIRWTAKPDGTVTQHWRTSKDAGATWADAFYGIYTRAQAAPAP